MLKNGKKIRTRSGSYVRIGDPIKSGGQGEAYWAENTKTGERGVIKIFHPQFQNKETKERIQHLIDSRLSTLCPVLVPPTEIIEQKARIGHFAPEAKGESLESAIAGLSFSFQQALQIAIALTRAIEAMHDLDMAHGDLHAENVLVFKEGTVYHVALIDLDNFSMPDTPPPAMIGQNLYMAPELRKAADEGKPAVPTIASDLFALAVLLHEIILLRHPAAGYDGTDEDFSRAMCMGEWLSDPAANIKPSDEIGGYPVETLDPGLHRMFRRAFRLEPEMRPTASEWRHELLAAFFNVYRCPNCGGETLIDSSKIRCPICRNFYPALSIRFPLYAGISPIRIESGSITLGRDHFGGYPSISKHHVIFRRNGPETMLESVGSNGTYRWNGSDWVRLPDGKPILVQAGDRLRIADLEAEVG